MYYLLEDNRIVDSTNEKDISKLKWNYNCEFHNGKIYFYKPRNNYDCKVACGRSGSFCVGCKDAFKAKFNKIKKQSENVFDLIEVGDLIKEKRIWCNEEVYVIANVCSKEDKLIHCFHFTLFEHDVFAIYKPDSEGNYIKVWEKKDKDENNT